MPINFKKIGLTVIAIIGLYYLFTFFKPQKNDEEYLLSLPKIVAEFIEKKQVPEARRFIAQDYKDDKGRTYQELGAIISFHTLQQGEISIYTVNETVDINKLETPYTAILRFKAILVRGPKEANLMNIAPERGTVYDFALNLEKTNDGWLVKSGDWAPGSGFGP